MYIHIYIYIYVVVSILFTYTAPFTAGKRPRCYCFAIPFAI